MYATNKRPTSHVITRTSTKHTEQTLTTDWRIKITCVSIDDLLCSTRFGFYAWNDVAILRHRVSFEQVVRYPRHLILKYRSGIADIRVT